MDRGGLLQLQPRLQSWLEGEMEEFALYAGGRVGEQRANQRIVNTLQDSNIQLDVPYGVARVQAGEPAPPVAHRPAFLHPVWLNRMSSDSSALEPWDYPEFNHAPGQLLRENINYRVALLRMDGSGLPPTLASLCEGKRNQPWWWMIGLFASLVPFVVRSNLVKHNIYKLAINIFTNALLLMLAVGIAHSSFHRLDRAPQTLELLDADTSSTVCTARGVVAAATRPGNAVEFRVSPGALLRRVDSTASPPWQLIGKPQTGDQPAYSAWQAASTDRYVAVHTESASSVPHMPVNIAAERLNARLVHLTLETTDLAPGQLLVLQTALGWQGLKASSAVQHLYLNLPAAVLEPGLARIRNDEALVAGRGMLLDRRQQPFGPLRNPAASGASRLLAQLLEAPWSSDLLDGNERTGLNRLGWCGIMQDPVLGRGMPHGQAVLYFQLPLTESGADSTHTVHRWVRLGIRIPQEEGLLE
jgi:hypothetical protein